MNKIHKWLMCLAAWYIFSRTGKDLSWIEFSKLCDLKAWCKRNVNAKKKDWFCEGDQSGQPQPMLHDNWDRGEEV